MSERHTEKDSETKTFLLRKSPSGNFIVDTISRGEVESSLLDRDPAKLGERVRDLMDVESYLRLHEEVVLDDLKKFLSGLVDNRINGTEQLKQALKRPTSSLLHKRQ